MRNQLVMTAWALATGVVPTVAMAQQQLPPVRGDGSWELSVGAGMLFLDASLRDFLASGAPEYRFASSATPGRGVPTIVARLGHNFTRHLGFSISGGAAKKAGITYLTPSASLTFTGNLNAKTSPFLLVGTEFTRISGRNSRVTHSTWGLHAGLGVRSMVSDNLALRLEGQLRFEGFDEVPMTKHSVVNPVVTLGLSYFVGGRRPVAAQENAPAPVCPVCQRQTIRVDTVRVNVPYVTPAPTVFVMRDTLVLEGVNFGFDESTLTPESFVILDRVARTLLETEWAAVRFEVAGHTSSIATAEYNQALSERRAETVRAYLVSRGVENGRMVARGYGETQPLVPNSSEGYAWQNRRVELRRIR